MILTTVASERLAESKMFLSPRMLASGLVIVQSMGGFVAPVQAQEKADEGPPPAETISVDVRGGIAIPTADMKDYVDEGPVLGLGLSHSINQRVSVRGDWTVALMRPAHRRPLRNRGVDIPLRGSETDLHHLTTGLQVELSKPGLGDVKVRAHGGVGVTFLSTEATELAEGGDFTQLTLAGGLELAAPLTDSTQVIGRGDLYVLPLRAGAPDHLKKEVTLSFSGGIRVTL